MACSALANTRIVYKNLLENMMIPALNTVSTVRSGSTIIDSGPSTDNAQRCDIN